MKNPTREQIYTISSMLQASQSQKDIALTIGKHKSIVCREIIHNVDICTG